VNGRTPAAACSTDQIAQLQADGIEVDKRQDESYGRSARIRDPEGNRIELYQELEAQV
jgi:catechol 2,3-dioxygenase-like lactoylglutathione lyase family enzyme